MADPSYSPVSNPFSAGDDFPSTDPAVSLPSGVAAVFCDYPHKAEAVFENLVVTSWNGKEKRSAKTGRRIKFVLRFEQISVDDGNALYNHFLAQLGDLHSFTYIDYLSGEEFTVRYNMSSMSRETFVFQAERSGIELITVI